MYEFEKHEKLTEFIQEMANTGKAPREWTSFVETLNKALRIPDVVGQSEKLPPNCSKCGRSGYSTGTPFCTDNFCNGGN